MADTKFENTPVVGVYDAPADSHSPLSWSAIACGAFVAAVVSLALALLGSSLGFATASPWVENHAKEISFTVKAASWLIVMQWAASALGGYLTGRFRCRWTNVTRDEVMFRDSAHGLLMWAIATLFTAAFLASSTAAVLGVGADAAGKVAAGAAAGAASGKMQDGDNAVGYYADSLMRTTLAGSSVSDPGLRDETGRILMNGLNNDGVTDDDRAYLARQVAVRTGMTEAEAGDRVDETIARMEQVKAEAKTAADKARKTVARVSIFTFLSMLVGAFIACVAAIMGGRRRDMAFATTY